MAANAGGTIAPAAESADCCMPSAAPLLRIPASSAAAVNESPFQAMAKPPATTNAVTTTAAGASSSATVSARETPLASPTRRSGRIRDPITSDQRPPPILNAAAKHVHAGEHSRRLPGENPRWSCRNRTTNPVIAICATR